MEAWENDRNNKSSPLVERNWLRCSETYRPVLLYNHRPLQLQWPHRRGTRGHNSSVTEKAYSGICARIWSRHWAELKNGSQ